MSSLTQEEVEKRYAEQGIQLLEIFKGVHIPHDYRCTCGKTHRKTPNSLLQKIHECPDESRERRRINKQNEYVKLFKSMGAELLGEYRGAKIRVKYRCVCGKISEITPASFRQGRRCFECGKKKAYSIRMGVTLKEKTIESASDKFMRELSEIAKKHNGEIINKSGKYVTFQCQCGSQDIKTVISYRRNPLCEKCVRKNRIEQVKL